MTYGIDRSVGDVDKGLREPLTFKEQVALLSPHLHEELKERQLDAGISRLVFERFAAGYAEYGDQLFTQSSVDLSQNRAEEVADDIIYAAEQRRRRSNGEGL